MPAELEPQSGGATRRSWHQALAFALTGRRLPALGQQSAPDLALLPQQLELELESAGAESVGRHAQQALTAGQTWPHPVPADLMSGLGFAQFAAALTELRRALGLLAPTVVSSGPTTRAAVSVGDQRLLDDVPPHHGQ